MGFSLSRCSSKPKVVPLTTVAEPPLAKLRATAVKVSSRKRPLSSNRPPIPSFTTSFSQLNELEREFLGDTKSPLSPLAKALAPSVVDHAIPGFHSSGEESVDDPILGQSAIYARKRVAISQYSRKVGTTGTLDFLHQRQQTTRDDKIWVEAVQVNPIVLGDDHDDDAGACFDYGGDQNQGNYKECVSEHEGGCYAERPLIEETPVPSEMVTAKGNESRNTPHDSNSKIGIAEIQNQIDIIFQATTDMNTTLKALLKKVTGGLGRPLTKYEKVESKAYIRTLVKDRINAQRTTSNKENIYLTSSSTVTKDGQSDVTSPPKSVSRQQVCSVPIRNHTPGWTDDEFEFCATVKRKPCIKRQRSAGATVDTNVTEKPLIDRCDHPSGASTLAVDVQRLTSSDKEDTSLPSLNVATKDGRSDIAFSKKRFSRQQICTVPKRNHTPGWTDDELENSATVQGFVEAQHAHIKRQRVQGATLDASVTEKPFIDRYDHADCSLPNQTDVENTTARKCGRPNNGATDMDLGHNTQETRPSTTTNTKTLSDVVTGPETLRAKRLVPRKRVCKAPPVHITNQVNDESKVKNAAPKPPPQRRARKGTCALCTTCPCNSIPDKSDDSIAAMFARSDSAVEKALIRRVQKMEKTCELHESRMEMVKRKLVHHRREIWKKKESKRPESFATSKQNQFLPDADKVGQVMCQYVPSLPKEIVEEAVVRIFPEAPCVQKTLSQWLRLPACGSTDGEDQSPEVGVLEPVMEEDETSSRVNMSVENDAEKYITYSKGSEYSDQVHRQGWNREENSKSAATIHYSLWKILSSAIPKAPNEMDLSLGTVQCTQQASDDNQEDDEQCPWDSLFEKGGSEVAGINQLVGLFGAYDDFEAIEEPALCKDAVSLSQLSQGGQTEAIQLIESIEKDARKLESLEVVCPGWKENVAFSMKQKDEAEVRAALEQVQTKRRQMLEFKRRIMDAWGKQDMTLGVFEHSLSVSLGRLDASTKDATTTSD